MSDPHVREIGRITADSIGNTLAIGIDHGHVTIKCPPLSLRVGYLDQEQAEEFARLFIAACWAAERTWPEPEPEKAADND